MRGSRCACIAPWRCARRHARRGARRAGARRARDRCSSRAMSRRRGSKSGEGRTCRTRIARSAERAWPATHMQRPTDEQLIPGAQVPHDRPHSSVPHWRPVQLQVIASPGDGASPASASPALASSCGDASAGSRSMLLSDPSGARGGGKTVQPHPSADVTVTARQTCAKRLRRAGTSGA